MHPHQFTYSLVKEFETFRRELPNLMVNEGKFVVVHGDEIIGTFIALDEALEFGYEKCGLDPFLVKKVEAAELDQLCLRSNQASTATEFGSEEPE